MLNISSNHIRNRYQAFGAHLLISTVIACAILYIIFFHWYPAPLFKAGGAHGLTLLLSVDMVLGPLLTLIIFNPTKASLKFDLTCIGIFQLACLSVGLWFVFNEKPDMTVLADNGVHIVSRADRTLFINQQSFLELRKNTQNKKTPFFIAKIPFDKEKLKPYVITKEFENETPFELITKNYISLDNANSEDIHTQIELINKYFISNEKQEIINALNEEQTLKKQSDASLNCQWTIARSNHFEGFTCINYNKGIIKLIKQ